VSRRPPVAVDQDAPRARNGNGRRKAVSAADLVVQIPDAQRALPDLGEAIRNRTAAVAVVGLGHVGLPLLAAVRSEGFPAFGLDSDSARVASLMEGRSYVDDVPDGDLEELGARFTTDPAVLHEADVVIISVPTPLLGGIPDLSMVKRATLDAAVALRPGMLIVLESTTYPGTTEDVVRPMLETSGLRAGQDFALAYSPERVDPGRGRTLQLSPKIVGGLGQLDGDLAELLYRELGCEVVRTRTPRDAEMAKLVENTFRQVNIALVNELATLAPDIGVDIWAAIEAAATKPFGYMPFWPGPGVGGHCIAIDPSYLSWSVGERRGFGIPFVEHARRVNNGMPEYVVKRIGEALNEVGKPIKGSKVLALGISYKSGVDDVRESPALAVVERLVRAGARCSYHDPLVAAAPILGGAVGPLALQPANLRAQDCVAILTAHPSVDYEAVVRHAKLVFDARGVTHGLDAPNVVLL
jgi:UDP-N-acetyl-D-glucosamine dehydrogenase